MISVGSLLTTNTELYKGFVIELQHQPNWTSATTPQLKRASPTDPPTLPDQPQVSLQDDSLVDWLQESLSVKVLDDATRFFWLVCTLSRS
jgi:hypothetical protein